MKLPDVLETLKGNQDCWFRPISWKGRGKAYCLKNGCTALVPTPNGGTHGMTCQPDELMGDWEIVLPGIVLDERALSGLSDVG